MPVACSYFGRTCVLLLAGVGCVPSQPHADDPDIDRARALLEQIEHEEHRRWSRPEPWMMRMQGSGSHGRYVELFASPEAADVLAAAEAIETWPVGAVFVAEGYEEPEGGGVAVLGVMVKDELGWTWAQYEADEPVVFGRPSICTGCHLSGVDLVRDVDLPGD